MKREKLKSKKFLPTAILVFFFLSLAGQTLAISCTGPIVDCSVIEIDCDSLEGILVVIGRIVDFGLTCIAGPLAILMLTIGGIWLLFAGGNPEDIERGRKAIVAVIIALLIIFLAKVILNDLLEAIGGPPI